MQPFIGVAIFLKIGGGDCWRGVPSPPQKFQKKILEKNFKKIFRKKNKKI